MQALVGARPRHPHQRHAERAARADPLQRGRDPRVLRSGLRGHACGAFCCSRRGCSAPSARPSSASAARCISSGAASISPSRAFPAGARRRIPAACPISPTPWRGKPIPTRSRAPASGREMTSCLTRPSILTPIRSRRVSPRRRCARSAAFYSTELREFLLPYEAVRNADDPDRALMDFLTSTYEAAAINGGWNRAELECGVGVPGKPRPV